MALEDSPFGTDQQFAPLGTLEAIELPGLPEAHLEPLHPERHRQALHELTRDALSGASKEIGRLIGNALPPEAIGKLALEQLESGFYAPNTRICLLFENAWRKQGPLLGFIGLHQTEEDGRWHAATLLKWGDRGIWAKHGRHAVESLLAFGQEYWNVRSVIEEDLSGFRVSPPSACDLDAMSSRERMQLLEGSRRFYSSPFGAITSTFHYEDNLYPLLASDIQACKEQVILNGMYRYVWAGPSSLLLVKCRDVIESGGSVELHVPDTSFLTQYERMAAYEEAGVTVKVRQGLSELAILDQMVYWQTDDNFAGLQGFNYLKRIEAERPVPLAVTDVMPLV